MIPAKAAYLYLKAVHLNGCTITAIGSNIMELILFRANTLYYTGSSGFNAAY